MTSSQRLEVVECKKLPLAAVAFLLKVLKEIPLSHCQTSRNRDFVHVKIIHAMGISAMPFNFKVPK